MTRVEMAIIIRGVDIVEEPVSGQLDGVAKQTEVEVGTAIDDHLADAFSPLRQISGGIVMQRVALGLADLATYKEVCSL